MPDEQSASKFNLNLPPHARITKIDFDAAPRQCLIWLDNGSHHTILPERVCSIHGARIRQETVRLVRKQPPAIAILTARMADWGVASTQRLFRHMYEEESGEIVDTALAVRTNGVAEIWYLVADSFNFRTSLGVESTNLTDKNLKKLVDRLISFAPNASQDAFVIALERSLAPPPPVPSLKDFLWVVARSDLGGWLGQTASPE